MFPLSYYQGSILYTLPTQYVPLIILLSDFFNLTQVHNFTVSAQDLFTLEPSTFVIYRKIHRNFAITYADNETFCTVLLASQVVMIQSLQPKGREFESTCMFCFLPVFDSFNFIYYRCTTPSEE